MRPFVRLYLNTSLLHKTCILVLKKDIQATVRVDKLVELSVALVGLF